MGEKERERERERDRERVREIATQPFTMNNFSITFFFLTLSPTPGD